jgi:hypothetical protein
MDATEKRTEADRRAQPRTTCSTVVIMSCGPEEQLEFEHARLVDCSPEGVGILFHRPLAVGSRFLLKVRAPGATLVSYVIRNCRADGTSFRIGAAFSRVIGREETYRPAALVRSLVGEPCDATADEFNARSQGAE